MKYIIPILIFLTFSCAPASDPHYKARQGVIDLSTWDFEQNTSLNGEWEFYWQKFYSHQDFMQGGLPPDRLWVPVPEIFNNIIKGNNGVGYATYRLILILPENPQNYALYIKRMPTSYRIYLNGQMIHAVGLAGTNKSSSYPVYSSDQVNLHDVTLTNELIIHTANYYDRAGGLWKRILIGTENKISQAKGLNIRINVGFLVLFFFLSIYHFVQFLTGINKQATLMLGFLCLMLGIRVLVMDELLILDMFPQIYSRNLMRVEFITFFSIIPILHLFFYSLYKDIMSKVLVKIQFIISAILDIITILTPTLFYVNFMDPYKLIVLISLVYLIIITVKAVRLKIPGSALSLTGLLLFASTAIFDIVIFTLAYESHFNLTPYGFLGIVFFESITIFKQLSEANNRAEILEAELRESIVQEQKMSRMKTQFIAHASHEFRTPLAVIQLSTDTLERMGLKQLSAKKRKHYFIQIQQSIRQITDIMDNILILGRQQSNHQKSDPVEVDLEAFINHLIESSFPEETRIIFKVRGVPFTCLIDPDSFRRAISNLISNAVKFSPQNKKIELTVSYTASAAKISIRDFGIGIPEHEQDHIFDDFYRGSNTGDIKGSGLGLSIARSIIEKHGADIRLDSVASKYTCFIITLKRKNDISK